MRVPAVSVAPAAERVIHFWELPEELQRRCPYDYRRPDVQRWLRRQLNSYVPLGVC